MIQVTDLYLRLFGRRIWVNTLLSLFGTVSPEDWVNSIDVSVCASLWVGRGYYQVDHEHQDVLLLKQDSLVTESSCRQSSRVKPQLPLAAAFMYHVPAYQFRVFCESVPRETLLLRLLVIPGAARGTRVLRFDKRSGAYHTSFNHQRSTKSPTQTQKDMCKPNGATRWCELESTYFVTSIYAQNTGTWGFLWTPFSTTFRWRIFLKPTGIDYSGPQ